mmetsp:Transcript_52891/g.163668  ORF Transcript_52891/g.163668 Transcript_52891/m.163668 type:complete len:213 (-) Transcript_52891:269-907(-)
MGDDGLYLEDASFFECNVAKKTNELEVSTRGVGLAAGDYAFYQKMGFIHLGVSEKSANMQTWEAKKAWIPKMAAHCDLRKKVSEMLAIDFNNCQVPEQGDDDTIDDLGEDVLLENCKELTVAACWKKAQKMKTGEYFEPKVCHLQHRLANRFKAGISTNCAIFQDDAADYRASMWALTKFDGFACTAKKIAERREKDRSQHRNGNEQSKNFK